jgi:AcrR family transcriptional regulator
MPASPPPPGTRTRTAPPTGAGSLVERHTEQTRLWLVEAACDLLESEPEAALVNAAIAQRAGVSERTVYRHFPTRETLLDAVATEAGRRLAMPAVPDSLAGLLQYPQALFAAFEAQPALTRAALKPEVFARMRDGQAAQRWTELQGLLAHSCPDAPEIERRQAAANIRYLLSATTWRYYRDNFGFDAEETVRCVEAGLRQMLSAWSEKRPPDVVKRSPKARPSPRPSARA